MLVDLDPALFGRAMANAAAAAARKPAVVGAAGFNCAVDLTRATLATASRALGQSAPGPMPPDGADRRFADPAWEDNPAFFWLCQSYLVFRRPAEDLVAAGELDEPTRAKAAFAVSLLADALAPTCSESLNPRPPAYGALDAFASRRSGVAGPAWAWLDETCASWPAHAAERYAGPWNRRTAHPVLVIGTTYDPATPYQSAVAMSHQLARARLLTVDGYGHTSGASACADRYKTRYLISGTLPPRAAKCAQDKPPFTG